MPKRMFFCRECPTCGRRLLILVEYLGKKVVCPHCGAKLDAVEASVGELPLGDPSRLLMQRVDELLESAVESRAGSPRATHPR
ncbi:MAG TPA: response regulator [Thermoguttaceae bacterium]|nr:response regulator [Thermoguttaceae bacterium]